jgi:membrane-associated phospholipid phosphatase
MTANRFLAGLLLAAALGLPSDSIASRAADPAATPSLAPPSAVPPFELGPADYAWVPAIAAVGAFGQYRYFGMEAADPADHRRSDLWAMDRWAAGNYSAAAAHLSDGIILPLVALPMALSAWDAYAYRGTASGGWKVFLTEAVIYAEAMSLSSSLSLLVRSTGVHPRPYIYGSDAPKDAMESEEASGSFYSGHANGAFAAATYLAYTYPLRHPEFRHKGLLWAGTLGAATTVAGLRVAAGKHFPSDILVGAGAGAFFGWLFPRLHLKAPGGGNKAELRLRPAGEGVHPELVVRF